MAYLLIALGLLYVLGAYLMWVIADENEPHDMKMRPYFSAFWPIIVIGGIIEGLINKESND